MSVIVPSTVSTFLAARASTTAFLWPVHVALGGTWTAGYCYAYVRVCTFVYTNSFQT